MKYTCRYCKQPHVPCDLLLVHETLVLENLSFWTINNLRKISWETIHNLQYCMTRTRKKRQALGRYTVSLREQPQVPRSLFRSFRHQNNTVENQACRQRPCWWKWGSEPVQWPIEWEQEEMTLTMGQKLHKAKESHAGKRFKRQELLFNIPKVELTGLLQVWELNAVFPAKD